jgi:hypothetical protein
MAARFDVFAVFKDSTPTPLWIASALTLQEAKLRISQHAAKAPGDFAVFSRKTGRYLRFRAALNGTLIVVSPMSKSSRSERAA